jgi:pimeloyl-ACP methyl ester carboxylesterase
MTDDAAHRASPGSDAGRAPPDARWPALDGVEHRLVEIPDLRVHVAQAGRGEPVLLLHGFGQHWWEWRDVLPALMDRYCVICPDLRGAGWTDAPAVGYTREQQMADAVALLDQLGLDRVRLIGHDAGTILGYTLCLTHPERVHSFVATGSSSPVRAVPPAHAPGRLAAVVPTSDRHARPRPGGAPFRTPAAPALPVPAVHRPGLPSVGARAGVASWWDVTLRRRTFACAGPTTARQHPVRLVGRSSTGRIRRLPTQRDAKGVSSCGADITWSKTCPRVGPSS